MPGVRLIVSRVEDVSDVLKALQKAGVRYFPITSESEPETILEVEGRRYEGKHKILQAISTELVDLHDFGRGRTCRHCRKPAEWLLSHQFAGDYYYCQEHYEQSDLFGKRNDMYYLWHDLKLISAR